MEYDEEWNRDSRKEKCFRHYRGFSSWRSVDKKWRRSFSAQPPDPRWIGMRVEYRVRSERPLTQIAPRNLASLESRFDLVSSRLDVVVADHWDWPRRVDGSNAW